MTNPKSECCACFHESLNDELICYMAKCTLLYGKEETERRIQRAITDCRKEMPCKPGGRRRGMIEFHETDYGFKWGALEVVRLFSDTKKKRVVIEVKTKRKALQIHATKTGFLRVFGEEATDE